jgi:hypothetical protein
MIIMSLRDDGFPSKQSPVSRGDCFATCARNDMWELQSHKGMISANGEELLALMLSILDKAFKGEL